MSEVPLYIVMEGTVGIFADSKDLDDKVMCSGTEAGSYLRLIDSCITQLKAQGLSRTRNESKEEGEATTRYPFLSVFFCFSARWVWGVGCRIHLGLL